MPKNGNSQHPNNGRPLSRGEFGSRVFIAAIVVAGVAILLLLLWHVIDVVLMVFAGILFSLILHTLTDLVSRLTHLRHLPALLLTLLLLIAIAGGIGWAVAPQVTEQVHQLSERLPQAVQQFQQQLRQYHWGKVLLDAIPASSDVAAQTGKVVSSITSAFKVSVEVIVGILVVFFVAIYGAVNPDMYLSGFLHLVPRAGRRRARQVLENIAYTLRWWMLGQLFCMVIIGVLTGLGLWLLGVPMALLIGILAGLLDFVPVVGTILSAIPAVFLAFLVSPIKVLYVVALYTVLHSIEAHLVLPLIQQKAVALPPVLTILTLVILDRLFGIIGILLAAPLAATIILLVKNIYVEDTLREDPSKKLV